MCFGLCLQAILAHDGMCWQQDGTTCSDSLFNKVQYFGNVLIPRLRHSGGHLGGEMCNAREPKIKPKLLRAASQNPKQTHVDQNTSSKEGDVA